MRNIIVVLLVLIAFSSCSPRFAKYQNASYKKVHHEVEKSPDFNQYNKYQKDFLVLANIVKDSYPNLEEYLSETNWKTAVDLGVKNLANANDTIAILEYQKFLALLKNNHTGVIYPQIYNMGDKIFFFAVHYIDGKWFIFDVHESYPQALVAAQLISVNDIPIDSVFKTFRPYLGEESEENMYHAAYSRLLFGRTAFLKALGLENKSNADSMKLTVLDSLNQEHEYMIDAKPLNKGKLKWSDNGFGIRNSSVKTDSGYVYRIYPEQNLAYLQLNQFMDKKTWKQGIKDNVILPFRPFAYGMLRNAYRGKPAGPLANVRPGTENMTKFYEEFFTKLKESDCENLVIDVRSNTGGDIFYTYQLISFLTDNKDVKLYSRHIKYTDFYRQVSDTKKLEKELHNLPRAKIGYDTLVNISSLEGDAGVFEKLNDPSYEYYVNSADKKFKGDVYVLTSPNSISAGTALPVLIQDNKLGTIVGRIPANRASRQTSTARFRLPNTSIAVGLSILYLVRPDETNTNEMLIPDHYVPVEVSREDYTFNYVLKLIESKK